MLGQKHYDFTNVRTLDKQVGVICKQFYFLSRDTFIIIIDEYKNSKGPRIKPWGTPYEKATFQNDHHLLTQADFCYLDSF